MRIPRVSDSSFGSALVGAKALGMIDSYDEGIAAQGAPGIIEPDPEKRAVYEEGFAAYRETVRLLSDLCVRRNKTE